MINYHAPDLTRHPPRSPRVRLGGFVHLPRLIDKARATLAGTNGDYHYDCATDALFWEFTGLSAAAFLAEVQSGKCDYDLLNWVMNRLSPKRSKCEIAAWSAWMEARVPTTTGGRAYFNELHAAVGPRREDVATWFDLLDLEDFVCFGGKS
ncbi:MAG: DUF5069 domain-containing protein [Verrucomicrobiota bacterium]